MVTGERKLEDGKPMCFRKELKVPDDTAKEKIQAKLRNNILSIIMPKKPKEEQASVSQEHTESEQKSDQNVADDSTKGAVKNEKSAFSCLKMNKKTAFAVTGFVLAVLVAAGAYTAYKRLVMQVEN